MFSAVERGVHIQRCIGFSVSFPEGIRCSAEGVSVSRQFFRGGCSIQAVGIRIQTIPHLLQFSRIDSSDPVLANCLSSIYPAAHLLLLLLSHPLAIDISTARTLLITSITSPFTCNSNYSRAVVSRPPPPAVADAWLPGCVLFCSWIAGCGVSGGRTPIVARLGQWTRRDTWEQSASAWL